MSAGVMALVARGGLQREKGLALASRAIERYPSRGPSLQMEALWRAGDYERATEHFDAVGAREESGLVFAEVFSDDHGAAREAFEALRDHGRDRTLLSGLLVTLYRFGEHDLVDALGELLPNDEASADAVPVVYLARAHLSDHETALESLSETLKTASVRTRLLLGLQAHGHGADRFSLAALEPLFDLRGGQGRYVRLVYAAAAARAGEEEAVSRIESRLADTIADDFYIHVTRMVLGETSIADALDGVAWSKRICEGGWFAAVRAEMDDDSDEAVLWMRLSFETRARRNLEWIWSRRVLRDRLAALTPISGRPSAIR